MGRALRACLLAPLWPGLADPARLAGALLSGASAHLHDRVASPNYLGEIIEWAGFALMTWSPAALAFAFYTVANLAPRASANLGWYRGTFSDYPPDRKALIPYVW